MTDTTTKGWAPVVYGRTLNADSWWRAVPAGTGTDGWLDTAVNAAVDGGNTLADGPRFLLSRSHGRLLVGVACRAADLHAEMNQHKGRALHCFVGWLAPAAAVGGPVAPRLSDLETHYRQWAGELYAKWVGPDWDEHRAKLRGPRPSGPVDVPWTGGQRPVRAHRLFADRPDGAVLVAPATERFGLWEAALAASGEATLVTGWGAEGRTRLRGATHVCVVGLVAPRLERPRPEPAPAPPQPPQVGPVDVDKQPVTQPIAREQVRPQGQLQRPARVVHNSGDGLCDCWVDRASRAAAGSAHWLFHVFVPRSPHGRPTPERPQARPSYDFDSSASRGRQAGTGQGDFERRMQFPDHD
ncbi:hypothetical protein [Phytohabitans flavus]|uniref:hypothetical protein n=1 Tax=Phytohabitans flavus TaxID=1076124 RepID=UPI0031EFA3BB